MQKPEMLLRVTIAFAGLVALWIGCDLASQPLHLGGPMKVALNPLGLPLVAFGVTGVALAPARQWVLFWPLAALMALATAGANFWHHLPIEDGAFQSLRAGVPDPDSWPAPAFLYALAFAPVGIALAALTTGVQSIVPLLLASAAAAVGAAFGLEVFASALLRSANATGLIIVTIAAAATVALVAARSGYPAGGAIAGQAVLLAALCFVLWFVYTQLV